MTGVQTCALPILTDDQIKEMQEEIDEEKAMGLGLPVSVTNDVSQQMMMSGVPQQPENPSDKEQVEEQPTSNTFTKLKQIL